MEEKNFYDAIIVGGGPAGLTAALYLSRARYKVLVVEKESFGGQITITADVVNYPGISRSSGKAITDTIRAQAQNFGAEFMLAEVKHFKTDGDIKRIETSRGELQAFGIILATGAHPREIGFEGEREFKGRGVAYCATCDGEFFTGLDVFVIGGGFAAAEEAVFLTKYARKVTMLLRGDDFRCAKSSADLAKSNEHIDIHYNTIVESLSGDKNLQKMVCQNTKTKETWTYTAPAGETFGVFVFAGYEPETDFIKGSIDLDEHGYILSDKNQKTNIDGIYAAGDVCIKRLRQLVTATSDGAVAATELERYIASMQEKTGLVPERPSVMAPKQALSSQEASDSPASSNDGTFISADMRPQLLGIFEKMASPLLLDAYLDERPVSAELKQLLSELTALSDKLSLQIKQASVENSFPPYVALLKEDGRKTGLEFHGVPGGHEFNSFVIGLYNAAGPGQSLDKELIERIEKLQGPITMQIFVSLTCTMCPELVMAAQRIASANDAVNAYVYDLNHFPALKDAFNVMSVPCLVVNGEDVHFGKKNVTQLLEILEQRADK